MESEGPTEAAPPPVVAVVVTRNPGAWLDEVMESLAAQDYSNLSVLVIDAASDDDPTPALARVMPGAFVRRLDENPGFGAAANEVLDVVEGAAFYLFCHDDVALAPDAVGQLVEEAFRSNAGIVGPKLVQWDDPKRLLQVGESVDKLGAAMQLVDRGELDQEQHDAVRDVFAVPGACTLIRADLFVELGGFDEAITFLHDDVSLCWRAHVAGARVLVAPAARVRHLEALGLRRPDDDRRRLQARHRLRIVLTCYGRLSLLRVIPQAAVLAIVEIIYSVVVGRTAQAREIAGAWTWNAKRFGEIRAARRHVRSFRRVSDSEVRRFQTRGFSRLTSFLRGQSGHTNDDRLAAMARRQTELAGSLQSNTTRLVVSAWIALVAVMVVGSRHLITEGVPAVGHFVPFQASAIDMLREWASGWRDAGLGSESPAPTGLGLFGLLGLVAGGSVGLVRLALIVGLLPAGAIAAHRLAMPIKSRRARIVAVLAYVAIPLPYNAIAAGEWGTLVMWAAAPLVIERLAHAAGLEPFADGRRAHSLLRHSVALGFIVALAGVIFPAIVLMVLCVAVLLVAGNVVAARLDGGFRLVLVAAGSTLAAVVLHLPWSLDFLPPGATWDALVGVESGGVGHSLPELLRFQTGPLGASPVGWVFLAAAALPLLIGRDWRLEWAVRAWTVALGSFALAWLADRGSLPMSVPDTGALLVPAAAGLALSAALGVTAFEVDLPGYRFGWRQLAAGVSFLALVVGLVPVLGAAGSGRWSAPSGDYARVLDALVEEAGGEPFRMLWLGDPEVLPLDSWELDPGLAYATSSDGSSSASELWAGSDAGATGLLAESIHLALDGESARLGRLLAPMGVRYIIVANQPAPDPFTTEQRPVDGHVLDVLAQQLDLAEIPLNTAMVVYRNLSAAPTRASVEPTIGDEIGVTGALDANLRGVDAVLPRADGFARWTGPVDADTRVLFGAASSARWQLTVDGRRAPRAKAFGWANSFDVERGGDATLRFRTSPARYGMLLLQALLWLVAVRMILRMRYGPEQEAPA